MAPSNNCTACRPGSSTATSLTRSTPKKLLVQGRIDEAMEAFEYTSAIDRTSDFGILGKGQARLEAAIGDGYRDFPYLRASRYFDPLRNEPRFQALIEGGR